MNAAEKELDHLYTMAMGYLTQIAQATEAYHGKGAAENVRAVMDGAEDQRQWFINRVQQRLNEEAACRSQN